MFQHQIAVFLVVFSVCGFSIAWVLQFRPQRHPVPAPHADTEIENSDDDWWREIFND